LPIDARKIVVNAKPKRIVMLGASGAVGGITLRHLLAHESLQKLSALGRRQINAEHPTLKQYAIDIFDPKSYEQLLPDHDCAICTMGVGEPSKISRHEFKRIDHDAVLEFAKRCHAAGVKQFHLLASVDADSSARSWYLRVKGQLCDELKALNFERLCIIAPSMILTPTNRYGFVQGVLLKLMPLLNPLMLGSFQRYRGIDIEVLGKAIAINVFVDRHGEQLLHWEDSVRLGNQ
jgi:putative NADH-flavin reductase